MRTFCSFLLAVLWLVLPARAETFRNPHHVPIPSDPDQIGAADFNGDGRPDFYYVDSTGLNVLLAKSDGSYAPVGPVPNTAPQQGQAFSCRAADFNGDGFADAVCFGSYVLTPTPATVTIYLGNGDGTFHQGETTYISGNQNGNNGQHELLFVAFGDINSDGHLDILFQDNLTGYLYTWFGDGAGSFHSVVPYQYATGGSATWGSATVADFNEDGHPDIGFSVGPLILLGKGDGTFTRNFARAEIGCHFADFDKDGHLDAFCSSVDTVSTQAAYLLDVLHGRGDGAFDTTPLYSVSYPFKDLIEPFAARDLNGDGYLDILGLSTDGLVIFYGSSGTQFAPPVHYAFYNVYAFDAGQGDPSLIADYNQDGIPDLAMPGVNGIYIAYGRTDGSFDIPPVVQSGTQLYSAAVADFNEDGAPDVVTSGSPALQLNVGKGDGTFAPSVAIQTPSLTPQQVSTGPLLVGDFNGDKHQDILVSGQTADNQNFFHLFPGHGDGTFGDPIATNVSPGNNFTFTGTADLNGDGRDDLFVSPFINQSPFALTVNLSHGDGTFTPVSTPVPAGNYYAAPVAGDFNHDGKIDLIVPSDLAVHVLLGHGDGTFNLGKAAPAIPSIGTSPNNGTLAAAAGDFDHDGNLDVALLVYSDSAGVDHGPSAVFVYYGDGHGGFSAPVTAGTFDRIYQGLQAADLNGDGLTDFVLTTSAGSNIVDYSGSAIALIHGMPHRTFSPETNLVAGAGLSSFAIADFNRDGQPDLLFSNGGGILSNSFVVLQNQGATSTILVSSANPSILGQSVIFTATVSVPPSLSILPSAPSTITFSGLPGNPVTVPVTFTAAGNTIVGAATYQTSSLPVGSYPLTASFSGNNEVNQSTSSTLTQTVTPAPYYTLAASQTGLGVTAGNNTNNAATIYVRSFNGFAGTVTLACAITPQAGTAANNPPTCSFASQTLTLNGADVSTQLIVTTTARASSLHASPHLRAAADSFLPGHRSLMLCGVLLLMLPMRPRGRRLASARIVLMFVFALALTACGSATQSPATPAPPTGTGSAPAGTPTGNYVITVSATSNTAAAIPTPITISLNVQ